MCAKTKQSQKSLEKLPRKNLKDLQEKDNKMANEITTEEMQVDDAPPKLVPKTIESMREADETTVKSSNTEEDEEVKWDIGNDEFKDYFSKSYEPKVLITTGDNPHSVSQNFENYFSY